MLNAKNTEHSCKILKLCRARWIPFLIFVSISLNSSIVALLTQPSHKAQRNDTLCLTHTYALITGTLSWFMQE